MTLIHLPEDIMNTLSDNCHLSHNSQGIFKMKSCKVCPVKDQIVCCIWGHVVSVPATHLCLGSTKSAIKLCKWMAMLCFINFIHKNGKCAGYSLSDCTEFAESWSRLSWSPSSLSTSVTANYCVCYVIYSRMGSEWKKRRIWRSPVAHKSVSIHLSENDQI